MMDIEKLPREAGMCVEMNSGAASCVWTEGCSGVSAAELQEFAALVVEECARVCERSRERCECGGEVDWLDGYNAACGELGFAIRSLITQKR